MEVIVVAALLALSPSLLVRRAQVDISPPELLPLGGYTERHGKVMEPGGDPLFARCIELEQGEVKVAIVSVEMLTIPESLYREVGSRIPRGIHLFMQATHTHCAPDSQMLNERMTFSIPGIASYKKRWLTWYADKIGGLVTDAIGSAPVEADKLTAYVGTVTANRARRRGGKPDPTVTEVKVLGSALLTHFTAHPTIYDETELKTRGDWPGRVAKETGAMVLNGAIGDVSPAADGRTIEDKFKNFMVSLHDTKKAHHMDLWSPRSKPLAWDLEHIPLDPMKPHPTFAKTNGIPEALAQGLVNQFAPPSADIVAVRVGGLAIVGVPGEPTSILGNQIKEAGLKMGFKSVLVCSHVNGWIGYILDPVDFDRGGYEATLSFYGREEGEKVVGAALYALKKLR
jgi:neutral ceramidase